LTESASAGAHRNLLGVNRPGADRPGHGFTTGQRYVRGREGGGDQVSTLEIQRADLRAKGLAISDQATRENRNLTAFESAQIDSITAQIRSLDQQAKAGAALFGQAARVTSEPEPYSRASGRSWFNDLREARRGNSQAGEMLARQTRQTLETRTVDLNTTAGTGGEFAPPLWQVDQFIRLARAARVTADVIGSRPLPKGVASVNLPKVSAGSAVAVQSTQGSSVQDTAATTTSVTSGIMTIAGQQTVSNQLLEQSGIPFDEVILGDLAAAYAVLLDTQVLTAAASAPWNGGGLANVASAGAVTYTQASPSVTGSGQFYSMVAKSIQTVVTTRYMQPTSIVMHPRRWAWILAAFDSQNRPLVVPDGGEFNPVAIADAVDGRQAAIPVGRLLGLNVYTDANIPTNLGAGTNQDVVYVLREADLNLYESDVQALSFDATFAGNLETLFRVSGYAAAILNRYPSAICAINGTGLITPSF
jgi:HK97 family phage major capsid protein